MRRQLAASSLALGIVATLSGCGGSSGYRLSRTEACFKSKGFQAEPLANHLLPGAGGNLRIALGPRFGDEFVFMVFGRSASDAVAIENRAVDLAMKGFKDKSLIMTRADVLAGVEVNHNVFYYSDSEPIAQNVRDDVQQCLR